MMRTDGMMGKVLRPVLGGTRASYVAAVVGAAIIWSTSYTVTKVVLAEIPPLTIGALRFALAAVVLAGLVWVTSAIVKPGISQLGGMALGGVLGTTIYFSMENIGVDLATATDASLLVASYPAMTMALEILVFRARAQAVRFAGVALAIAGVYLIISQSPPTDGDNRLLGNMVLVAAGLIWALYNFATRKATQELPNLTIVFYQTLAGAMAFAPLALLEAGRWQAPSVGSWLIIVYLGIFCSVVAFLLYAYGLKELDSGSAVNLLNLVPVFGVLSAFVVLREPVGVLQLLGGLVVLVGVVLGLNSRKEAPIEGDNAVDEYQRQKPADRNLGD